MQERATPALRWWRALVLTSVAFGLGVVAHLSAGGLVPGSVGLGLLFAVTLVVSASLLGRAASTLRVTALVMGGQAFIHAVLTAASEALIGIRRAKTEAKASQKTPVAVASITAPAATAEALRRVSGDLKAVGRIAELEISDGEEFAVTRIDLAETEAPAEAPAEDAAEESEDK